MRFFILFLALSTQVMAMPFHQIVDKDIDGKDYPLMQLKGKPVLVVNIASQCGYTGQLEDLQKLHQKFSPQGLVVLGVPSNDFGGQTPEDDAGMKEFCQKKYNVSFPLLRKGPVSGKDRRPLYTHLTKESAKPGDVSWNFTKFLVDKNGVVVQRWSASEDDEDITAAIQKVLK